MTTETINFENKLTCSEKVHIFGEDSFCFCGQQYRVISKNTSDGKSLPGFDYSYLIPEGVKELEKQPSSKEGVKHDRDKPPMSMVSHVLMEEVSKVRAFGAKKYNVDNWKKGFKVTRSLSSALRHIFAFLSGQDKDEESGQSHLAHAICCLEHALWDMRYHPTNDDRYKGENK